MSFAIRRVIAYAAIMPSRIAMPTGGALSVSCCRLPITQA
jgi:hypothetical protein